MVLNLELKKKAKSSISVTSEIQNDKHADENSKVGSMPPIFVNMHEIRLKREQSSKNLTFNYYPKYGTRFVANSSVMNYMYLNKLREDSILDS